MDLAGAVANLLELGLIAVPSAVLIEGTVGLADDLTPYAIAPQDLRRPRMFQAAAA